MTWSRFRGDSAPVNSQKRSDSGRERGPAREWAQGVAPAQSRIEHPPVLESPNVRDVAGYIADRFVQSLRLDYCVVYLYDGIRANLVAAAVRGNAPRHRAVIPLGKGASLGDLEVTPEYAGTAFSLPLWDTRRLVGVVHGRIPARRRLDEDALEIGRALCRGGAVALSLAVIREEEARARERVGRSPVSDCVQAPGWLEALACAEAAGDPHEPDYWRKDRVSGGLNPALVDYLEEVLDRTGGPWQWPGSAARPVAVAFLRLSGPGSRGRFPTAGKDVWTPNGRVRGRGFGLGPDSTGLALVWPGVGRMRARKLLSGLTAGKLALDEIAGPSRGARAREEGVQRPITTRVKAAALAVFPEDASSAASLLATAADFLDVQTYLVSRDTRERGESTRKLTGEPAAALMDSRILSAEIDRLRQVLVDSITDGQGFAGNQLVNLNERLQDPRTRDISERLDRLIVVMQRYMSHRGAVT